MTFLESFKEKVRNDYEQLLKDLESDQLSVIAECCGAKQVILYNDIGKMRAGHSLTLRLFLTEEMVDTFKKVRATTGRYDAVLKISFMVGDKLYAEKEVFFGEIEASMEISYNINLDF